MCRWHARFNANSDNFGHAKKVNHRLRFKGRVGFLKGSVLLFGFLVSNIHTRNTPVRYVYELVRDYAAHADTSCNNAHLI